jgi:uncharacterized protein (UPF0261 family)
MTKPVVLLGALDTKGADFAYVRDLILAQRVETLVVDFGVLGEPGFTPDIANSVVAEAGGETLSALRAAGDKAWAMRVMRDGLAKVLVDLFESGRVGGALSMAGGGGTSLACYAMRHLPVGIPKLMVTTVAGSGDISGFIGTKDITLMPAVVDIAGLNRFSRQVYQNAAAAIVGMVRQPEAAPTDDKPLVCVSMFGNTTACVNSARGLLESAGYEVLVFHATGTGGRTMEALIEAGFISANLDLTTTELADDVCGGVMSAGPERLMAASRRGVPTLLVPGCVDMANFWGAHTLPERYRERLVYAWNPDVTLLRTNVEENREIGRRIARAANEAVGPVAVLLPLNGVSQLDSPGGPFWDPEADEACFSTIRGELRPGIRLVEVAHNINDPEFAALSVRLLLEMTDVS